MLVEVCKKNKDWFLKNNVDIQLYGRNSGNGLDQLEKMINKDDVSSIIKINNAVYEDEKKQILKNAYLFIQVSRHEGQPMGIIEALCFGIPCIVTYGTSFGEFVRDNKCGLACEFNSEDVFKKIKIMFDTNMRNNCSKNAIKIRKQFDWNIIIIDLIKKYNDLMK